MSAHSSPSKTHNKSGQAGLSINQASAKDIADWLVVLGRLPRRKRQGLCASACLLLDAEDGRISVQSKKVAYGYQLVAYSKFGRDAIAAIPASKDADSGLLSHLCGTRNCIEPSHIVIEPKRINDERTHCHYSMSNIFRRSGRDGVDEALKLGLCNHIPMCGSLHVVSVAAGSSVQSSERQKVGVENLLYRSKLQETPGKSPTTAGSGLTSVAAAAHVAVDGNKVGVGAVHRPNCCNPLGQSASKLPNTFDLTGEDEEGDFLESPDQTRVKLIVYGKNVQRL